MKRRSSAGGKPRIPKGSTLKGGNAPKAERNRGSSIIGQETVVARLTRERDEALKQQTAASEVLRVISSSPSDLESVFRSIRQADCAGAKLRHAGRHRNRERAAAERASRVPGTTDCER